MRAGLLPSALLALFAALLVSPAAARLGGGGRRAPLLAVEGETIDSSYIVVLSAELGPDGLTAHIAELAKAAADDFHASFEVKHEYRNLHSQGFLGYAAVLSEEMLEKIRDMEGVEYVEPDQVVTASCDLQSEATWGIARIDKRELDIDGMYSYDASTAGEGVDVYVIDTGVLLEHVEFQGRATWGFDSIDNPSPKTDGNGHGTHVAGTVAGMNFGVAKKASIIAVRVLNANGSGSTAGVIAGVDYTAGAAKASGKPSVGNMSLGGGRSDASNAAVEAAVAAGVSMVVAAGNSAMNACLSSPASAPNAVTVGATDSTDSMASFSNYGPCLDIFAPGVQIESAWINSIVSTLTISGTSMAAPHVAGVAAIALSANPGLSPAQVTSVLTGTATTSAITGTTTTSPNLLLFSECL